jgi:hypothetical protein
VIAWIVCVVAGSLLGSIAVRLVETLAWWVDGLRPSRGQVHMVFVPSIHGDVR